MLRKYFYPHIEPTLNEAASVLHSKGLKADILTLIGLMLSFFSAAAYGMGLFFFGAMFLLASGLCDMLDGALARQTKTGTAFGAFFDSVIDRYADFFILSGILIHYMNGMEYGVATLALVALLGSMLTSYTKARMECFPAKCDIGLIERPERVILIFAGSFFGFMVPALWVLAILSHFTVFQRIWFAKEQLSKISR
ncbi:MAG: CDP-alcohol phosphatidyltransferase family protein [Candidatus Omnitrophica bacterium]|nr:CDP-alcohol phosphatidyltransferase family protein [Candidatus Omnitrophota bacterium]